MCVYTCVYIYIYTLVFKSVANFICIKFIDLFLNFWTGVYIYVCVCVYIYTYTYIHTYIYTYIYIYIYTHTYIYTYTCIYIHIHIHLCIYLHILTFPTREIQWYSAYSFLTRVSKKASQGQRQLSSLGTLLVLISSDFICNLSLNKRQHRPLGPVSLGLFWGRTRKDPGNEVQKEQGRMESICFKMIILDRERPHENKTFRFGVQRVCNTPL